MYANMRGKRAGGQNTLNTPDRGSNTNLPVIGKPINVGDIEDLVTLRPPLKSSGQSLWLRIQRSWVRSPVLAESLSEANTSDVHAPMFVHGECDELKKSLRAIQEENYKLQAVITDVTEVNKRWQKYNNDRQMYVQRLLSTIQEQQDYINKTVSENIFPYKQGHFLPRGTTLYFSDDLTSDGVRKKSDSSSSSEELPRPRSHSVEEEILKFPKENSEPEDRKSGLPSTSLCQSNVLEKPQVSDGNNNVKTLFKERSSDSLNKFVPNATCSNNDNVATLNIVPENYLPRGCLPRKVSSSVLQISPTSSTSLVSEAHTSSESGVNGDAGANAVSIGFSSNGLASVTTFSQIPIAKSFSLPLSQEVKNNNRTRAIAQSASDDLSKASSSRRKKSFYSTVWSAEPIVAPPSLDRLKKFSESSLSMDNNGKYLCSETAASGGSTTTMVNREAPSWKSKYSEEGVTTQTKEDVICPGCGKDDIYTRQATHGLRACGSEVLCLRGDVCSLIQVSREDGGQIYVELDLSLNFSRNVQQCRQNKAVYSVQQTTLASYHVAWHIAKHRNPHSNGEDLVKLASIDMVRMTCDLNHTVIGLKEKLIAFKGKLKLWKKKTQENKMASFPNLNLLLEDEQTELAKKLNLELVTFKKLWLNTFEYAVQLPLTLKTHLNIFQTLLDSRKSSLKFKAMKLCVTISKNKPSHYVHFGWIKKKPIQRNDVMNVLLPFSTTYRCEAGFSILPVIKTKMRSKLQPEHDLRSSLSTIQP
uniref:Uncharacterized protein n=1 Tax=Timema bartmani TaxID=61472 RepID=A0A7R9EXT4_9NEOP|nr:unnamed protein product [Timema bartmani]